MASGVLYRPGSSVLHRTDPRAKFVGLLAVLALALTTTDLAFMGVLLAVVVAALTILGRLTPRTYGRLLVVLVPLAVLVTIAQGLVQQGDALLTLGAVDVTANGLLLGGAIALRLCVMALVFAGFAMTTDPTDIALGVHRLGVPYKFAYLTSFGFRFLPLVQNEARTLLTAMSVRASGDPVSLNPYRRARALLRMVLPLMVGSLRRSGDIALAMELRGYGARRDRTFVRTLRFGAGDWAFLLVVVVVLAVVVFVRLAGRG